VNILSKLRKSKKINQQEIAKQLNISISCFSQYETRKRQPPISLIPKMARILGCSIEDIVLCFCNEKGGKNEK